MNTTSSSVAGAPVRIGALAPLTRPGWTEAGRHLVAGLELAVTDVNGDGGIGGRPVELVVRDTAANAQRAEAAVAELEGLGVVALAGEFVALEGYDTIAVLAAALRAHGVDRQRVAASWPHLAVEGTRGPIRFSRVSGVDVWQWAWPPVQVVDRDPAAPGRLRVR